MQMNRRTQMLVGFYGALAGGVTVLLLPVVVIVLGVLWTRTSLSSLAVEPESRGFLLLYCAIAWALHVPLMIVLALFAYAIQRCSFKTVVGCYSFALAAMAFSARYYVGGFISFPCVKYFPALLYLLALMPLLSVGLLSRRSGDDRRGQ